MDAEELAKKQKSISIAEFFEKNRQLLGFDSASKAMINSVKEAVDNSLDACEEADILPDILVVIKQSDAGYRVMVEDNGPGIVREQIPNIFGKFLYGSRFHSLRQSRGQQGIGISAVVLHSQLTTGKPTRVISKTGRGRPAHLYELMINTSTNEPEILREEEIEWDRPRGTSIEFEIAGSYVRGRRQCVYEYLRATSLVNPHARITLIEPDGNEVVFDRICEELPVKPKEIPPHPHGMELGTLMSMLRRAEHTTLESFLVNSFSRIGRLTAKDVCKKAGIEPSTRPDLLGREDAIKLLDAFHSVSMKSPPVDCLSPITERLMYESIRKEYDVDFIATVTRKPSVYKGYPFLVEGAIAYGGELPKDERATILRFANKVPLLYQQSACAITNVIERMNWKLYSLQQPGGGIPVGPVVIMVHVASVNIPYLSEAKEAIAHVPEIEREIEGALREVGRKLRAYLSKKETVSKRKGKELVISKMLPLMAEKVGEVLEREPPDVEPIVAKIVGGIHIDREMDGNKVRIKVRNFSQKVQRFVLHELCEHTIKYPTPHPSENMMGNMYDYSWDIRIRPDEEVDIEYIVEGTVEGMGGKYLTILEGVEDELVVGDVDEVLEGGVKWLRSKR